MHRDPRAGLRLNRTPMSPRTHHVLRRINVAWTGVRHCANIGTIDRLGGGSWVDVDIARLLANQNADNYDCRPSVIGATFDLNVIVFGHCTCHQLLHPPKTICHLPTCCARTFRGLRLDCQRRQHVALRRGGSSAPLLCGQRRWSSPLMAEKYQ